MATQKGTTVQTLMQLQVNGCAVRAYRDAQGATWWVAADVGRVLGIQSVRQTVRHFPKTRAHVCKAYMSKGIRRVLFVNEGGLCQLIFCSRKPEALQFEDWVCDEVLPALSQTGTFTGALTEQPQLMQEIREHLHRNLPVQGMLSFYEFCRLHDLHPKYPRHLHKRCREIAKQLGYRVAVVWEPMCTAYVSIFDEEVLRVACAEILQNREVAV